MSLPREKLCVRQQPHPACTAAQQGGRGGHTRPDVRLVSHDMKLAHFRIRALWATLPSPTKAYRTHFLDSRATGSVSIPSFRTGRWRYTRARILLFSRGVEFFSARGTLA